MTQPRSRDGRYGLTPQDEWTGNLTEQRLTLANGQDQWGRSYRDDLPDDEYNVCFTYGHPARPRNLSQVLDFWRKAVKSYPDSYGVDMSALKRGLDGRQMNFRAFFTRETGITPDRMPGWTHAKRIEQHRKAAREWVDQLGDPRDSETLADCVFAMQLHFDATWLDHRDGVSSDDPDAAVNQIGRYWQTRAGRTPRELVERFRLYNVMGNDNLNLTTDMHPPWHGGRTYIPVQPHVPRSLGYAN